MTLRIAAAVVVAAGIVLSGRRENSDAGYEIGAWRVPTQVDRLEIQVGKPHAGALIQAEWRKLECVVGHSRPDGKAVVSAEYFVL